MTEDGMGRALTRVEISDDGTPIVVEHPIGELADGHVRVSIEYVGICHSDIAAVAGGDLAPGSGIGHEMAGSVRESRSSGYEAGDRVIVYGGGAGYSTFLDAPPSMLVRIDDRCSMQDAALAEPVACVIGGLEMIDFTHCSEVALVGAGFMGLIALRYLATLGHDVTVIEPSSTRRERAIGYGATAAIDPSQIGELDPGEYSVAIEATGVPAGLDVASDLVAIDGTLGILGYHQSNQGMRSVPMERWNYKAITVKSLHHRDVHKMIRWVDRAQRAAAVGTIRGSDLIEAEVGFEDACRILRSDPTCTASGALKALLVPGMP